MKVGKIACLILGAGASVRFGGTKQLAQLDGKSLIQRALDVANESKADYVLLVVGGKSSEILEQVQLSRAQVILNKDYERGISTSIRSGVSNLPDDCVAVVIMVADQPYLTSAQVDLILERFRNSVPFDRKQVVALSYKGEPRNPVLIPRAMFEELLHLEGDIGARELVRKSKELSLIDIDDPKVFLDIDTKDSLLELKNKRGSK